LDNRQLITTGDTVDTQSTDITGELV